MTGGGGGRLDTAGSVQGTSSNRCDRSAISRPVNVARLVVDGLCFLLAVFVLVQWLRARRRLPSVKQLLPWHTYGVLLLLTALYLTLGIILTTLGGCFIIAPSDVAGISVPASLASGSANLVLLGIMALPLTRRFLQLSGHPTRMITIINLVGLAITVVAFIPYIVLSNMASIYRFTFGINQASRDMLAKLGIDFSIAFYTTYFTAALFSASAIVYAASRSIPNATANPKKTNLWLGCIIVCLLLGSGSAVVQMFAYTLPARRLPDAAWITFLAIFNVSFILAVFAVLEVAQTIAVPMVDPKDIATYDPESSEETQPALHRRFTYTRSLGPRQPQHVYASQNQEWPSSSPTSPHTLRWPFASPTRATFRFSHQPTSPVQHAF